MSRDFSIARARAGFTLAVALLVLAGACAPMAPVKAPDAAAPDKKPDATQPQAVTPDVSALPEAAPLRPGQTLRLQVHDEPELSRLYVIAPEGTITLPWAGPVMLQDLTPQQAQQKIQALLKDGYLRDPVVTLEIVTMRPLYMLERGGGEPGAGGAVLLEVQGR